MITDAFLSLSAAQAVTASAVSTNTLDLGTARDIGAGEDLKVVVTVDESFATATSVAIQVISSAAANLGSPTILIATDTIPIANLAAGRKPIIITVPRAQLNAAPIGARYLGLNYAVTGTNASAGKFTASIVMSGQDVNKNYASGFTIA